MTPKDENLNITSGSAPEKAELSLETINASEILNVIAQTDRMIVNSAIEQTVMTKKERYLRKHKYKIWFGSNGKWMTWLPDRTKNQGRRLIYNEDRGKLEDMIVEYYINLENNPCFRDVFEEWIRMKEFEDELSPSSIIKYRTDYKRFFPPSEPFCRIPLRDMMDADLSSFIKRMIKQHELTPKAYSGLRLIILGVFKFAKSKRYTEYSIGTYFKDLQLPKNIFKRKIKDRRLEVFSKNQAKAAIQYCLDNPSLKNLGLALDFHCGLRVSELSALRISDNIRSCVIRVHATESERINGSTGKKEIYVKEITKTEAGMRDVIIPREAQLILNQIKAMRAEMGDESDYLFYESGKRITSRMFQASLTSLCRKLGLDHRSMHKIRKTYGSVITGRGGLDDAFATEQMGHKDISTTREYYVFDVNDESEKFEKIEKVVKY